MNNQDEIMESDNESEAWIKPKKSNRKKEKPSSNNKKYNYNRYDMLSDYAEEEDETTDSSGNSQCYLDVVDAEELEQNAGPTREILLHDVKTLEKVLDIKNDTIKILTKNNEITKTEINDLQKIAQEIID